MVGFIDEQVVNTGDKAKGSCVYAIHTPQNDYIDDQNIM